MPISRMQQPRQLYGLGSIVKKIGKAAKKIVKSDLGKAAIAYTLTGGLGNLAKVKDFLQVLLIQQLFLVELKTYLVKKV